MTKKLLTLALLSGGFLTALGANCIPNISATAIFGGLLGGN